MFNFNLNLELGQCGGIPSSLRENFPSLKSIAMASKDFEDMGEAALVCAETMNDILLAVNHACGFDKFKLLSEINPIISGLPTISKSWAEGEISKIWMIETSINPLTTKKIAAQGLGQVFSTDPIEEVTRV